MLSAAPDMLRADLQRFYGLDMDELGYKVRVRRMADLAANLPEEAGIWGRLNPQASWDTTHHLLANIADNTSFLAFTKTRAAQRHGTWHGAIERPGSRRAQREGLALNADEMLAMLSQPRSA